jgi:hypothetical protein
MLPVENTGRSYCFVYIISGGLIIREVIQQQPKIIIVFYTGRE